MGSVTATYRIPKAKIPVRLLLTNRRVHRVEVFVPLRRGLDPPGKVLRDLLEQPEPFLPAHDLDSDSYLLLARRAVIWASAEKELEREVEHLELYDHRARVRVELQGGTQLDGELYYTAPSTHPRVVDHLNNGERFFFLHRRERLYVVSKTHVIDVIEEPAASARP